MIRVSIYIKLQITQPRESATYMRAYLSTFLLLLVVLRWYGRLLSMGRGRCCTSVRHGAREMMTVQLTCQVRIIKKRGAANYVKLYGHEVRFSTRSTRFH